MFGYKAVTPTGDALTGLVVKAPGAGGVLYQKDVQTVPQPNCGPLCIGLDLDELVAIAACQSANIEIRECEYVPWEGEQYIWVDGYPYKVHDSDSPKYRKASAVTLTRYLGTVRDLAPQWFWEED